MTLHATDDGAAEHSYESTIAVMGGRYLIPVNRAHRTAAGAEVGQERDVTLVHNTTPDEIVVPDDLAAALEDAGLTATFAALARSHRKEHVRAVIEAKRPETRARRIAKSVAMVAQKTRH